MAKRKPAERITRQRRFVTGGEQMVSGRGGIGNNEEMPMDQHSNAKRGRAEEEPEAIIVNEDDWSRNPRRKPGHSKHKASRKRAKADRS